VVFDVLVMVAVLDLKSHTGEQTAFDGADAALSFACGVSRGKVHR